LGPSAPRDGDQRARITAVLHVLSTGTAWKSIPAPLPPKPIAYPFWRRQPADRWTAALAAAGLTRAADAPQHPGEEA